jgi:HEAT repeat protein
LASLQAQLGEEEGVERLLSLLELPSTPVEGGPTDFRDTIENLVDGKQVDPGGLRLQVLYELGILGPALAPEVREEVADAVLPLLHDADPGLAHMAALALQNLPGERSLEGLRSLLSSPRLDLRGQAAVSLSHLGDSTGAPVLRELVDPSSYDRDRADARARWTHGSSVSHSRARAVAALARLDLPDDRALLEELAADEPDPAVRQAAMRALEDRPDEP